MGTIVKNALVAGGLGLGGLMAARQFLRHARWFSFRDKVVLITGGARGLGLVLARQLVDAGARVAICARTESQVLAAEKELRQRGGDVVGITCDVRNREQVRSMVDQLVSRWGRVDVLFNIAGVIGVGPIDAMTEDDFHQTMDIHCWGPLNTIMAVLPHMRRQHWGRIVNVSSIGGKVAVPHLIPYVASKFALVGLSHGLRTELTKENILVTTICPGLMRTGSPRNAQFKAQHRKEYAWFSIGDSLPLVSMDAAKAAARIMSACQAGEADVTILGAMRPAIWLQSLAPNLVLELMSAVNTLLPQMGGIGQRAARGFESQSRISPSWLTHLTEQAAAGNNQLTGTETIRS